MPVLCRERGPLRLDAVLRKSMEMYEVVAEATGVRISAGRMEPIVLQGDEPRLLQVANNVIDNAIKFTPAGGVITIEVFLDQNGQGAVTVADTGAGIPPEDVPYLFERF